MSTITWIQPYYDLILYHIPINSKKILDVGAGYGIFGYALKKTRKCIVEAIEPFDYELNHYDHRFNMTWQEFFHTYYQTFKDNQFTPFDVVVSTEMIEHLPKKEALEFLDQVKTISDKVIIATPSNWSEQDPYDNNEYQRHRSLITAKDFKSRGYSVKYTGVFLKSTRGLATRFYYHEKLKPLLRLMGIKSTNIIGIWQR